MHGCVICRITHRRTAPGNGACEQRGNVARRDRELHCAACCVQLQGLLVALEEGTVGLPHAHSYEHTRAAPLVHGHASALTRTKAGAASRALNRQHAPRQHPSRAFSVVASLLPAAFCTRYAPSQAASAKWASWLGGDGVGDVHRLGIAPAMSRAEVGRVQRSAFFGARCTCVSCILHVQNDMPHVCSHARVHALIPNKLALTPRLAPQYTKIAGGACSVPWIPQYPRTRVIGARRVPLESAAHLERALATLLTLFPCGTVS